MWDLPLDAPDPSPSDLPGLSSQDQPRASRRKPPGRRRSKRGPRRPVDRKKLLLVIVGFIVLLASAYLLFWPKPPEAQFSPSVFSSGDQRVGVEGDPRTVMVTNVGERPMPINMVTVIGDSESEFLLGSDGCTGQMLEPLANCTAELRFRPVEMGQRDAALEIHAEMPDSPASLALSGTGIAPLVEVSPGSLVFDPQDVGSRSRSRALTIRNAGTAPLEIAGVGIEGSGGRDFRRRSDRCSKQTLAPGADCAIEFSFSPRAAGKRTMQVKIESDALEQVPPISISGEGIWTGAAFAVEPKAIRFGDQLVGGEVVEQRVLVTNRQSSTLNRFRVTLSGDDSAFEVRKDSCTGGSLAPGDSCSAQVAFSPAAEGTFSALLEIGSSELGLFGIEVEGRGVVPKWVASSDALDLGTVGVGAESAAVGFELLNEGSAAGKVTEIVLSGDDAPRFRKRSDGCSGQSLQPGSNCRVEVLFSAKREGAHAARLTIGVSAGSAPPPIVVSALSAAPRFSLDLELIEFGQVHRTTRKEVILTASNPGTADLQLEGFELVGEAGSSFRLLGGTCFPQATVPPQKECTVRLGFDPLQEGRITGRLAIRHNGLSGPTSVSLAGTGLPPPAPEIFLSTGRLDFGPQAVGERSPIRTVTVNSAGTGQLKFYSFEIEGSDASSFQIVPATCHAAPSLLPGSSCAIGVRMVPSSSGAKGARLIIRHNSSAGSSSVELIGEGLGGGS